MDHRAGGEELLHLAGPLERGRRAQTQHGGVVGLPAKGKAEAGCGQRGWHRVQDWRRRRRWGGSG